MKSLVILGLVGRVWTGEQPAARPVLLLDPVTGPVATAPRTARLDEVWLSFVPKVQVVPPGSNLPDANDESMVPELAKTQALAKQLIK